MYRLCSTGAGKPFVSPARGGKCAAGQKTLVVARAGALGSLRTKVTSLKGHVSTLKGQVSTLKGQVSTLQSDDSSLKSQVSTLTGQVSTLQSDEGSLSGRVSTVEQKLTPVSYNASGLNNKPTLEISGCRTCRSQAAQAQPGRDGQRPGEL